jgi:hypothetical protein
MLRSRIAAVVFGSALAVGGFAATALAESDSPSSTTPSPSTPERPGVETHVATTGGPVTLNVAGVGTVTLTVDPNTAAISNVVVTPIDGVTTGAPMTTPEGVEIQVSAADGTSQVLEIKARHEDAGLEVEAELEVEDHEVGDDNGQDDRRGPNRGPENGDDNGQNDNGQNDNRGRDGSTPSATTATQGVFSPGTGGADDTGRHANDQSGRDQSGGKQSGGSSRSGGGQSGSDH